MCAFSSLPKAQAWRHSVMAACIEEWDEESSQEGGDSTSIESTAGEFARRNVGKFVRSLFDIWLTEHIVDEARVFE